MRTEKRTYTITIADNGKVLMFNDGENKIFALSTIGVNNVQELTIEQAIEQGMSEEQAQQYATETHIVSYNQAKEIYDVIEQIGGLTTEIVASDKVGQDFKVTKINGIEVYREYVQGNQQGTTADNAIEFIVGITCKPNTFYSYMGMTYVYMGSEKVANDWFDVREHMVLWENE